MMSDEGSVVFPSYSVSNGITVSILIHNVMRVPDVCVCVCVRALSNLL